MKFFCNEPKPERRIRRNEITKSVLQYLQAGQFRDGLDVIDSAALPTGNFRADYSWLKGTLHTMIGYEASVLVDRAESYKLAIKCFEEAVLCDPVFLVNTSPDLPETRWAIRGYPGLVEERPTWYHRILETLGRFHFAPDLALETLQATQFSDLANTSKLHRIAYADTVRRLRRASRKTTDEQTESLFEAVQERVSRYEHEQHDPNVMSCLDGNWFEELSNTAEDLLTQLKSRAVPKRARAACILGLRGPATFEVGQHLAGAMRDHSLEVRAQAALARAELAQRNPKLREEDRLLGADLVQCLAKDRSYLVRMAAADALASLQIVADHAVPQLIELLESSSPRLRRANGTFAAALARYNQPSERAERALLTFDPHPSDEAGFVAKATALLKLSADPEVKRECVKHLECAQRRAASYSTRLGAVKGILESDVPPEHLLGILIERMYLDPRYSIREYARRMLIRKNHELAVKLDAFEDRV